MRGHARQIAGRLRVGESLSQALTAQPGLLPPEAEVLVHIGTRTNQLPAALSDAATRQIRTPAVVDIGGSPALTAFYLTAVPTVMLLILSGLMYFIVPKYRMIFEDFGVQMPPVSEWLIDASAIFADAASFPLRYRRHRPDSCVHLDADSPQSWQAGCAVQSVP